MRAIAGKRSASTLAAALLALTGCGGSASDKAGGTHRKPVVLTMVNPSPTPGELQAFAHEVAKRSGGRMDIKFENAWRAGEANFEPGLISDVRSGKADLGWVGTRGWDA